MTKKRFTIYGKEIVQDDECWAVASSEYNADVIATALNELAEENEQLRKEKIDAEVKLYSANEKILMQMDYDEIIKQNTENEIEITNLKKENEQLKEENYELHKRLGDFEPFERYMKERTSKTSLEDIIGIVKTDEPTNSVELKKELYK